MSAIFIANAYSTQKLAIPFFSSKIQAGFPSPAQDYIERTLDLNDLCIRHPNATFFVRVTGDSMIEANIFPDDVLVVDRSLKAEHEDIIIAAVSGEFTVKQLYTKPKLQLIARNKAYPSLSLTENDELTIFGVVTNIVRQIKR